MHLTKLMCNMLLLFFLLSCLRAVSLLSTGVDNESNVAVTIVAHEPSLEVKMSTLHPKASRKLEVINVETAQTQHKQMQKAIGALNATVYVLRDVLLNGTQIKESDAYKELFDLAQKSLVYRLKYAKKEYRKLEKLKSLNNEQEQSLRTELNLVRPKLRKNYQEKYRLEVLRNLTTEELVDIVFRRPIVELHLKSWFTYNRAFVVFYQKTVLRPLGTLYFMRDQQITTRKGIVMLKSIVREGENVVTEFVFKKLGLNVIGKLDTEFADGGDFIPFGELAFFGEGRLSHYDAIKELMANDLFGCTEIAIVRDKCDFNSDRLHLDTFFNILDRNGNVVVAETVLTNTSLHRFVDLYSNNVKATGKNVTKYGNYVLIERNVEFGEFLKKRNFKIIPVTNDEQLNRATNFLNIGNGTIVSSYCESSFVNKLESIGIKVICVCIDQLNKGNGGIHCMTQVVHRKPNY